MRALRSTYLVFRSKTIPELSMQGKSEEPSCYLPVDCVEWCDWKGTRSCVKYNWKSEEPCCNLPVDCVGDVTEKVLRKVRWSQVIRQSHQLALTILTFSDRFRFSVQYMYLLCSLLLIKWTRKIPNGHPKHFAHITNRCSSFVIRHFLNQNVASRFRQLWKAWGATHHHR